MPNPVPTHLLLGSLGAGKTTSIAALFTARPVAERWAVLVNEIGTAHFDSLLLNAAARSQVIENTSVKASQGGLAIRELSGGCLCCTLGVPLQATLLRLLREVHPHRLFIEPSGVGHASGMLAALQTNPLAELLDVRAIITLVDPRRWFDAAWQASPIFRDQLAVADVVVGNHSDAAGPELTGRFLAAAQAQLPQVQVFAAVSQGQLDPAWLELPHRSRTVLSPPAPRAQPVSLPLFEIEPARPPAAPQSGAGLSAVTLAYPPGVTFDLARLLQQWAAWPTLVRSKGVWQTETGPLWVNQVGSQISTTPVEHTADSRWQAFFTQLPLELAEISQALLACQQ